MSELVRGVAAPLFDRLAADPPDSDNGMLETTEALRSSIGRELSRLLNTRSRLAPREFADGEALVIDYGVPDFSALSAQDALGLMRFQIALRLAVERYEPRLADVTVSVQPSKDRSDIARVRIDAQARVGIDLHRVDFEMLLNSAGCAMNVV